MSLFVNPAQFGEAGRPRCATRATRSAISPQREVPGVDLVFAPSAEEMYPPGFQTWVEVTELGSILEGRFRPGHFRGVATIVLKLLAIVRPDRVYFGQKDAQQVEVVRQDDPRPRARGRAPSRADGSRAGRAGALVPKRRSSPPTSAARALALSQALATRDREAALALLEASNGIEIDYVERADFDPPTLAGAIRVGSTRLIDNVPLEGDAE